MLALPAKEEDNTNWLKDTEPRFVCIEISEMRVRKMISEVHGDAIPRTEYVVGDEDAANTRILMRSSAGRSTRDVSCRA
jgi:hypothetical protein